MIALNLVAPIKLLRGFAGAMKEHRYGRIVNMASIAGRSIKGRTLCLQCDKKRDSWSDKYFGSRAGRI